MLILLALILTRTSPSIMTAIAFGNFTFDKLELENLPPKTKKRLEADEMAALFLREPSLENVSNFSLAVFRWGQQGMRVYSKLKKPDWNRHALGWLTKVPDLSAHEAIEASTFKGVGVSFLSKHLRILHPDRFVTLDSVIEDKLGYARNHAGYLLFLNDLLSLKEEHQLDCSLGDLEEAIYRIVRAGS